MRQPKIYKKVWAAVLVAVMTITVMTPIVTVTAEQLPVLKQRVQIPTPTCTVLWNRSWINDQEPTNTTWAEPGRVVTDQSKNIYVCGRDNAHQATIIKYDTNGNLQWDSYPDDMVTELEDLALLTGYEGKGSGQQNHTQYNYSIYEQLSEPFLEDFKYTYDLLDLTYCSFDHSIVACGHVVNLTGPLPIMFVTKIDADTGEQIWKHLYGFLLDGVGYPLACSVVTDVDGNVYLSGVAIEGRWDDDIFVTVNASGLALKVGPDGFRHWAKIDKAMYDGLAVYTCVDVDSNGYPFCSGYYLTLSGYSSIFNKRYKTTGEIIRSKDFPNDHFWNVRMKIDRANGDNLYAVGGYDDLDVAIVAKLTPSFDRVYRTFTNGDCFFDLAFRNSQYLIVASERWHTDQPYSYATLRPINDDIVQLNRFPSDPIHYTAVDEEVANDYVDYIGTSWAEDWVSDSFEMSDMPPTDKPIYSVTVHARVICTGPITDGIPNEGKLFIKEGSSTVYSNDLIMGNWWSDVSFEFDHAPTGQVWTQQAVNNLKAGISFIGTMGPSMMCSQIYCVVRYLGTPDQYTVTLVNKDNGFRTAKFNVGAVHDYHAPDGWNYWITATNGIAVDADGDVIATGGFVVWDTIKCRITTDSGKIAIPN